MYGYNKDNAEKVKELTEQAPEQLMAYLYLENSDQAKYGTILAETVNVLSNHNLITPRKKKKPTSKDDKEKEKEESNEEATPLAFAQMEGKCYCCGKKGHLSPECKQEDKIPKEYWAIHK
eukprot:6543583-Ditylum_brightwellii.AAC.1